MVSPSLGQLATSLLLLWCKEVMVEAMNDPNNHPRFRPPDGALPSQYTFNQHVSIDPMEDSVNISAETEALTFYSDDDTEATNEAESNPTLVSSSLLYEGGSVVSTEAITCHGGDLWSAPEFGIELRGFDSSYDIDESDDDEDEDDDDDGHNSMLSNASLRRSRVLAYGAAADEPAVHRRKQGQRSETTDAVYSPPSSSRRRRYQICRGGMNGCNAALCLRGGNTATELGTEFAERLLVAAIVTLVYETLLGHFLEFLKIVMQTSPPGTSYGDVVKHITDEKGIIGIWDGMVPWGVVQALCKGGVFGLAYAIASKFLLPLAEEGTLPKLAADTIAGGIAGGVQGFVLSPTLLLKTRVMTNPVFRENMSALRTCWLSFRIGADVVLHEGFSGLMKGAPTFATKRVFDWSTRYYFSDVFDKLIRNHKGGATLTAKEMIAASLLGGTASTLVTLPLDALVAKSHDAKKAGEKVSSWKLFRDELREHGWIGVKNSSTRGFEARLAHVCFTTVVMRTWSPIVYDALFGQKS